MIVAMAVVTTMMMPPTLRWALSRVPLRKEEEARLDREAFAERGFVTNMERLLLAVDDSANGKFASRLGGLLAGSFGLPTTVLHIDQSHPAQTKESAKEKHPDGAEQKESAHPHKAANGSGKGKSVPVEIGPSEDSKDKDRKEKTDDRKETKEKEDKKDEDKKEAMSAAQATVKAAAEKTKPLEVEEANVAPPPVDVVAKAPDQAAAPEDAVAGEASKGYDFMLIGVENTMSEPGVFHDSVSRIASGFEGPLAVVMAQGKHAKRPLQSRFKILVPVTGTAVSRRGAEVALALAHAAAVPITALFVSAAPRSNRTLRRFRQDRAARRSERAILKDIVELADNFDTPMSTATRRNDTAEEAILREARRGGYDLIVMGVNRRPGETLYFGRVAAAVMARAEFSVLFVASESYAQERRPAERKEVAR
jgi:nucleotide-binding universal stress UspA family protein